MRYELKSIGLWAFFRVAFFLNLALGFISGLVWIPFMLLAMLVEPASSYDEFGGMSGGDEFGLGVLLAVPFIFAIGFGVLYTIVGFVMVGLYNLVARLVGGFELVLEPVVVQPPPTAPAFVESRPPTGPPPTTSPPSPGRATPPPPPSAQPATPPAPPPPDQPITPPVPPPPDPGTDRSDEQPPPGEKPPQS